MATQGLRELLEVREGLLKTRSAIEVDHPDRLEQIDKLISHVDGLIAGVMGANPERIASGTKAYGS